MAKGRGSGVLWRTTAVLAAMLVLAMPDARSQFLFHDDGGRSVAVPARIERVWPAGPPAAALLYIVAPEKLMGWVHAPQRDAAAFLPARYRALPELGRLTGRNGTVGLDAVRHGKPDLILDIGTIDAGYIALANRVEAETHIPYVLLGGALAETPVSLRRVGTLLGEPGRAEALARYAEQELDGVRQRIADIPRTRRPSVYFTRGSDGLVAAVQGSINAELIDLVGARNVVPRGSATASFTDVSMDQLRAWQPDVIVTIDPDFYARVATVPEWRTLGAVREKRVYLAPGLPFGWADEPPSANRLIGLRWLAKKLYPERFPEDLRAEVKRFYTLFYQRAPTDAQLDLLLGGGR